MRGRIAAFAALGLVLSAALCAAVAPAASPAVTLSASSQQLSSGQAVTLTGTAIPGTVVALLASPYPYTSSSQIATTTAASDGSFAFTVVPDRNVSYVAAAGQDQSSRLQVNVVGKTVTKVRALSLGRAQVTVVVFHPRDLLWGHARVSWAFASGGGPFRRAPATRTQRVSPYVIVLRSTVTLPAGPFRWRACFRAPGDQALLTFSQPGCAGRAYDGSGSLPAGVPGAGAVARAAAFLATRTGNTAFAVMDSVGRLSGVRVHELFNTASVVKAMLLTAYLRRLAALGRTRVDGHSNSFLYPMIHVSDNNAATTCWSIVGDAGLYAVARAAGMTDFSVSGLWGTALLSPADQARFFFEMDSLIPTRFVAYARRLLSTIAAHQSWAIPAVARPLGYQVFFKDGSEPFGSGQLVHQVARLEGHGITFALAVMTDADPTMDYGIATIEGVAAALLR